MPTIEIIRGLTEPTVGGDTGIWGGELNTTIGAIAGILGQNITLFSSTFGTSVTLTSSQGQSARIGILNTSSSPVQLNLPSSNFCNGGYSIGYASSQGQNLTITAGSSIGGGGGTITLTSTGVTTNRLIFNDGTNIFFNDIVVGSISGLTGAISAAQIAPTVQRFISGSTNYFPTSSAVVRIRAQICGGGGGGRSDLNTGPGSSGGTTSFGFSSAPFTTIGGGGGSSTGNGGVGGTGGTNGAGTLIYRFPGGIGQGGWIISVSASNNVAPGSPGGVNLFGGGGGAGQPNQGGGNGIPGTGGGGGGGGSNQVTDFGLTPGPGGGAGEYAAFWITSPSTAGMPVVVGPGGAGEASGLNAGGNGGTGGVYIEEFYI